LRDGHVADLVGPGEQPQKPGVAERTHLAGRQGGRGDQIELGVVEIAERRRVRDHHGGARRQPRYQQHQKGAMTH
jgi:hypothetical protein